jgi:hypothetical protein|tara:strand:+ start:310 stop:888 length:579 start_codon:yes stop_codon:yes gene_type:complete
MIKGDSVEYEKLTEWVKTLPIYTEAPTQVITCEIGVREGLGSQIIMDEITRRFPGVPYKHMGIDPYGSLPYQHYDDSPGQQVYDYTDDMMNQMIKDFTRYPEFKFHNMTDTEFMNKHPGAGPFDFVHFDGPHMTKDVLTESIWFANRSRRGTRFVFDDYTKYAMDQVAFCLTYFGFKTMEAGTNKICLEKKN